MTMKNAVFWDVTLYGSCDNRRFGVTYHLYHQGDKNQRDWNISSISLQFASIQSYY
jgi:hypothetical protein